ncbi:polypeptide n-acetylgalactosaminyltransferase 5 [Limosa lapponica baueri]|uniref:Polypeptide n-acetylgalactosaminyltransferase 5 n=1 Tax=Limosa lapponica baueri TaxID=1758121 RepID=A0A2I0T4U1_LIMLA|nr:polypeptide n-acetylgalactosaminyltransferase 5 [Limosa lapponica baueri]
MAGAQGPKCHLGWDQLDPGWDHQALASSSGCSTHQGESILQSFLLGAVVLGICRTGTLAMSKNNPKKSVPHPALKLVNVATARCITVHNTTLAFEACDVNNKTDHIVWEHLQQPACLEADPSHRAPRVNACDSANPYQKWQFGNYHAD